MAHRFTIFRIVLVFATIFIFIRTSDAANVVAIWLMDEGNGKEIKDSFGCRLSILENQARPSNAVRDEALRYRKPEYTNGEAPYGLEVRKLRFLKGNTFTAGLTPFSQHVSKKMLSGKN